jgi:hypothetical protein
MCLRRAAIRMFKRWDMAVSKTLAMTVAQLALAVLILLNSHCPAGNGRARCTPAGLAPELGAKHGGASQPTRPQIVEGLVGRGKWIAGGVKSQADLRSQAKEFVRILTCEIGDRYNTPLAPEIGVWKGRNVAHVNSRANDATAFFYSSQGDGDQLAHWGIDDRGIQ